MRHIKIKRVIAIVLLLVVVGIAGFGGTSDSPSNTVKRSPTKYELAGHVFWLLATLLDWPVTMVTFGEENNFSSQPADQHIFTKTGNYRFN